MEFRHDARPSPIAGAWYTGDPKKLAAEIDQFIAGAKVSCDEYPGKLAGLVAPHAGHRYSGRTAGYAYKLAGEFPRALAVILSPMHQYSSADFITSAHRAYQTPLGEVALDQDAVNRLDEKMRAAGLALAQTAGDEEHSIEIQLPFLQRAWPVGFSLLPVMVRSHDPAKLQKFAQALHEAVSGQDHLLVASTDLSHFYPQDHAEVLDAEMLKQLAHGRSGRSQCRRRRQRICLRRGRRGSHAVDSQLAGATRLHPQYSSSADARRPPSAVGWGAAVFRRTYRLIDECDE